VRDAAKEFTRQARALIFADRFSHFEQQQAGGEARGWEPRSGRREAVGFAPGAAFLSWPRGSVGSGHWGCS